MEPAGRAVREPRKRCHWRRILPHAPRRGLNPGLLAATNPLRDTRETCSRRTGAGRSVGQRCPDRLRAEPAEWTPHRNHMAVRGRRSDALDSHRRECLNAMMFGLGLSTKIYLGVEAVAMRKGFDGLYGLVRDQLGHDPLSGHLFLCTNRSRTRLKVLAWDGTGLWVCAKRLERGRFHWPTSVDTRSVVMRA